MFDQLVNAFMATLAGGKRASLRRTRCSPRGRSPSLLLRLPDSIWSQIIPHVELFDLVALEGTHPLLRSLIRKEWSLLKVCITIDQRHADDATLDSLAAWVASHADHLVDFELRCDLGKWKAAWSKVRSRCSKPSSSLRSLTFRPHRMADVFVKKLKPADIFPKTRRSQAVINIPRPEPALGILVTFFCDHAAVALGTPRFGEDDEAAVELPAALPPLDSLCLNGPWRNLERIPDSVKHLNVACDKLGGGAGTDLTGLPLTIKSVRVECMSSDAEAWQQLANLPNLTALFVAPSVLPWEHRVDLSIDLPAVLEITGVPEMLKGVHAAPECLSVHCFVDGDVHGSELVADAICPHRFPKAKEVRLSVRHLTQTLANELAVCIVSTHPALSRVLFDVSLFTSLSLGAVEAAVKNAGLPCPDIGFNLCFTAP
jgi:hypothetical protein